MSRAIPLITVLVAILVTAPGCGDDSPEAHLNGAWDALCVSFIECDDPALAPPPTVRECVEAHQRCDEFVPTPECAFAMADLTNCIASQPCYATFEATLAACAQAEQAWDAACGDIEPPIRFLELDPVCQFN